MSKKLNSQTGALPMLVLFAALGLLAFLFISNFASFKDRLFSTLFPKPPSHAANLPVVFRSSSGEILPDNSSGIPIIISTHIKIELTSTLGSTGTAFYRIAESSADLNNALYQPYTEESTVIDYTFQNSSFGSKFIWVEFKDSTGTTDRKSAQIELISPVSTSSNSSAAFAKLWLIKKLRDLKDCSRLPQYHPSPQVLFGDLLRPLDKYLLV